ncbi:MAG: indolepyruvate ferredoxin oxidoreductase subunit alpha [Candidatus Methanofastidiosia archaeon]
MGKKILLMGNEAIARGAMEAGVRIAAAYPGTPSSEIGETLAHQGKENGVYFEWSVNEKVALEVATAGSYHGLRSMASMKSLGLNVASDTLNVINFNGVGGGLVIISADDPQAHSSTNEQDGRWHVLMASLPLLEPSDVEEAYLITKWAFELSEKFDLPVVIRTVTRLGHARGDVEVSELGERKIQGSFLRRQSYRHSKVWNKLIGKRKLYENLKKAKEYFESFPFNRKEGDSKLGIICCGLSYQYTREALKILGVKASILKLVTTYPIPERLVREFVESKEKILVLEELSPIVEMQVRALTKKEIYGKNNGFVPLEGELNPDLVKNVISKLLGIEMKDERKEMREEVSKFLTPRIWTLCAGCPHRAVWYTLKKLEKKLKIKEITYSGDIGCYTLLAFPPYKILDTVFAMGSSTAFSSGSYHANPKEKQVTLIGDSTFFHSGITGLINAIYNNAKLTLVILDNRTTAMTGFEPHPGVGVTAQGDESKIIYPERVAEGLGVEFVKVFDPFDLKSSLEVLKEALSFDGVSVCVARQICSLKESIEKRRRGERIKKYYVTDDCEECTICVKQYQCAALSLEGKRALIDQELCTGCGVCPQICPFDAIEVIK